MTLNAETVVGVVGAGTMGAGIAQVAATHGHRVVLMDADPGALESGLKGVRSILERRVAKGKLDREDADALLERIQAVPLPESGSWEALAPCGLVVEAILEDLDLKQRVFAGIEEVVADDAVLATNTSSLSVAAIASACREPSRVLGIHFFNPAPVMPLVEIVAALTTDPAVARETRALVDAWGKVTVMASDTPGFIVNRIARPFYGEALRMAEEGLADYATIDMAMKVVGGFRMGPFELMDLIGNDVNYAVNASVYEAMGHDPRYRPSVLQRRMVDAGLLGRKTGRGFYEYGENAPSGSGGRADRKLTLASHGAERGAAGPAKDEALADGILLRILSMLINEAVDAVRVGVAEPQDVELAMTRGVGYPMGLLAWGEELGWSRVLDCLTALGEEYGEERYRPSPLLRRLAREGGSLLSWEGGKIIP